MKFRIMLLAAAAAGLAAAAPAEARRQIAAEKPKAASTAVQSDQQAAAAALDQVDAERLIGDPAYAATILRHIDTVEPLLAASPGIAAAVAGLRTLALYGADRRGEARAAIDRLLENPPTFASPYGSMWLTSMLSNDFVRAMRAIEQASLHVTDRGEQELLLAMFDPQMMVLLIQALRQQKKDAERNRLADALVRMDWPGPAGGDVQDAVRLIAIDARLAENDPAGAAAFASGLVGPDAVLSILILDKYRALWGAGDPIARIEAAVAEHDRGTAAAMAGPSLDTLALTGRADLLRATGRAAEALELLEGAMEAVPAAAKGSQNYAWLLDSLTEAQVQLGRGDDALAAISAIEGFDPVERHFFIQTLVVRANLLLHMDRPAEALSATERLLAPPIGDRLSGFGKTAAQSVQACALDRLGRSGEARTLIRAMEINASENPPAMMVAYACIDDLAGAERTMIAALASDEPLHMMKLMQVFREGPDLSAYSAEIDRRIKSLRARPAAQAAIARAGRILTLPYFRF